MWRFLVVPWVGLECVIVVSPDHTHLYNCIESGRLSMTYLNQDFEADIHIIQDFEADIHIPN